MSFLANATVIQGGGSGIPEGRYRGKFIGFEEQAPSDGNPITGEGKRLHANIQFRWEVVGGPMVGKILKADCGQASTAGSRCVQICEGLAGKTLLGLPLDPTPHIGREYLLQYGPRMKKSGRTWTEVLTVMSAD